MSILYKKTRKLILVFLLYKMVYTIIVACVLTFYSTFSLNNDYKFESKVYDIKDGYIKDVDKAVEAKTKEIMTV